jgi:cytochrome P450
MLILLGMARYTTETKIVSGFEIPPGCIVSACPKALMKDANIWPDAGQFIPERWLESYKGAEVDRKAYFPFSAGSRNCIGQQ